MAHYRGLTFCSQFRIKTTFGQFSNCSLSLPVVSGICSCRLPTASDNCLTILCILLLYVITKSSRLLDFQFDTSRLHACRHLVHSLLYSLRSSQLQCLLVILCSLGQTSFVCLSLVQLPFRAPPLTNSDVCAIKASMQLGAAFAYINHRHRII